MDNETLGKWHSDLPHDYSWMDDEYAELCEELESKAVEIYPTREWNSPDDLLNEAAAMLGDEERYAGIFMCIECGALYHQHESSAEGDYCGFVCEIVANDEAEELWNS